MREAEHRALLRAAVLLLGISVLRWTATVGRTDPLASAEATNALTRHQAATAGAVDEAEERSRPLAEDERIDPNDADEVQLDRLPGVGPATARAIIAARDSGTVFRRADDLLVVRGIGPASLERVRPWVETRGRGAASRLARPATSEAGSTRGGGRAGRFGRVPGAVVGRLDVNEADAESLQTLPGVGPSLAARIVAERRVRAFDSVDDLVRVRGIGPATVARLRPLVSAGPRR